jgi:hemerythrin-like domain-containing protein
MVVQLGKKPKAEGVVGRLLECHERIRRFTDMAVRLGAAENAGEDDIRSAAGEVRRYFVEALPLHVEDEERSIVPRLEGREPELDAALARMHAEHESHEPLVSSLLSICDELVRTPASELRGRLIPLAADLRRELGLHLEEEEAIILPAIDRLISKEEQAQIVAEMAARRS